MAEAPDNCVELPAIVGWENTPQVGSLLPVGLGPISKGCTPNTRICIGKSRISVRAIMTKFWNSLPCSIVYARNFKMMLLLIIVSYLQAEFYSH